MMIIMVVDNDGAFSLLAFHLTSTKFKSVSDFVTVLNFFLFELRTLCLSISFTNEAE
jgi:hypothetical protein